MIKNSVEALGPDLREGLVMSEAFEKQCFCSRHGDWRMASYQEDIGGGEDHDAPNE